MSTVRSARVRYGVLEAAAPWCIACGDQDSSSSLYLVTRGSCWLLGAQQPRPLHVGAGDVVLVPNGSKHVLCDTPASEAYVQPLARHIDPESDVVTVGGTGVLSTFIYGELMIADHDQTLFSRLPPVVHLVGAQHDDLRSLGSIVALLAAETGAPTPATPTVVNRLLDVLFVKVVSAYFASNVPDNDAWAGALRDRQVSDALSAIQAHPEYPWTVASLAEHVSMSRSAFASRFNVLVGDTPLQYVTRARMQRAAALLRGDDERLASVAEASGYESEAAFSKAFKRFMGMSPSEYRRTFKG